MLILVAGLALVSAAYLLFRVAKPHGPQSLAQLQVSVDPPPNARPLFAPTDEELRREDELAKARAVARREYHARARVRGIIDKAVADWRDVNSSGTAAELLRATATDGLEGDFSRAANEIIEIFYSRGIDGLRAEDLAALLDSHLRLVPAEMVNSGELFWLRQEIERLLEQSVSK